MPNETTPQDEDRAPASGPEDGDPKYGGPQDGGPQASSTTASGPEDRSPKDSGPKDGGVRPTDDAARALARRLIAKARFAALAVLVEGAPHVSRIAMGTTPEGAPLTLVSGLALHTAALQADPRAGLLLGEPGAKGDPLTHPRLSLSATARFVLRETEEHSRLHGHWLAEHPKSALYIDLPDFRFVVFTPVSAALNGGFGRAFRLTERDLTPPDRGAPFRP